MKEMPLYGIGRFKLYSYQIWKEKFSRNFYITINNSQKLPILKIEDEEKEYEVSSLSRDTICRYFEEGKELIVLSNIRTAIGENAKLKIKLQNNWICFED